MKTLIVLGLFLAGCGGGSWVRADAPAHPSANDHTEYGVDRVYLSGGRFVEVLYYKFPPHAGQVIGWICPQQCAHYFSDVVR